jgi:tetrahydromethanopterin S-methyltransferase subunit G
LANLSEILQGVVPSALSGLGTAASAVWAYFREVKKKVDSLEKRLGSTDSKSGLVYQVAQLEWENKEIKSQLEGILYPNRGGRINTLTGLEGLLSIDQVVQKVSNLDLRLRDLEEKVSRVEGKLKRFVTESDFTESDKERAKEISTVKETLSEVRGMLQMLQSALGLK